MLKIRPYQESDAKEVYAMLESTEEVHVGGLTYSEKAVQNWHVTRAQDVILVVEVHGVAVGFIASRSNDPEPSCAYIDCLIIKPEHRGRRIGRQLLDRCISSLRDRDVEFVHLHVRSDSRGAVNFWEKNGFKGKEPLLWMYKDISKSAGRQSNCVISR